jgi:hypothetical protein
MIHMTQTIIEFTKANLGWLVTDGPGVEDVIVSLGLHKMGCTQNPETRDWTVSNAYARRLAEALRSSGFTVTGISTSSGLAR